MVVTTLGLYCRVPKIKIPVTKPCGLVSLPAVVDLKGKFPEPASAEDFHLFRHDLDLTGGKILIFRAALSDGALHRDRRLLRDLPKELYHFFGLCHDLCRSVKIPQHNKPERCAHLPEILHPSRKLHLRACIRKPQVVTGMRS